tara:strand:- start:13062 stop:13583 length:522 start_codon:yes stop_codon:yes gene_type:complete
MEINKGKQMKDLETIKMQAILETTTFSGSAFAVNSQGEQIFINQRIMERMNLEEGVLVTAHVLPNYDDKRQSIPWRAMRVDVPRHLPDSNMTEITSTQLDNQIIQILSDKSAFGRLWTDKEIASLASTTAAECHRACVRLHERSTICRVDFSSDPNKIKSAVMWGADISDFKD